MPTQESGHHLGAWDALAFEGFWQKIDETDMHIVMLSARSDREIPRTVTQRSVDGAVFFHASSRAESGMDARAQACPWVTVNVGFDDEVDAVCPDDEGGIRAAIEHLAALGHRRIAYVNTLDQRVARFHGSVRVRQTAYLKAMAECGLRAVRGQRDDLSRSRAGGVAVGERSADRAGGF